MRNKHIVFIGILSAITLVMGGMGCSASYHAGEVNKGLEGDKITVGTVQRQVKIGMSSAEVIEALGSPNVVTTDDQRREVWVYDKIATDVAASSGYWTIGLVGQSAGAASKSQRTLTIVIKFDQDKKVRDFAYHSSKF
jgi:outer membrane protein assembly factor BamE (lipoprotein component of BamABCDE complex)